MWPSGSFTETIYRESLFGAGVLAVDTSAGRAGGSSLTCAHVLICVYVRTCEHMCVFYGCFWFNSAFHLAFVFLLLYQQVTAHMC